MARGRKSLSLDEQLEIERLAIPLALADGWEPYNNYLSFT